MSVKAERRLRCVVRIGRTLRLDTHATKYEFNPANAVVFEKHYGVNLEFARLGNVQLKGIFQRLARLHAHLFAALRTEATILSSAGREAENSRRLPGLIREPDRHCLRLDADFA